MKRSVLALILPIPIHGWLRPMSHAGGGPYIRGTNRLAYVFIALVLGIAACSDNQNGPFIVPGEVGLAVDWAEEESSIASMPAAGENMYIVVGVTLTNGLESAIIASSSTFRLRTNDGLERLASPMSELMPDVCPSTALLGSYQMLSCNVAFEVPLSVEPTAVIYFGDVSMPNIVEAEVKSFERCSRCSNVCVDLATSDLHCGACGVETPIGGVCVDGTPQCSDPGHTICDNTCVDLSSDPLHCGACFQMTGDALCVDGVPSCPSGLTFHVNQCLNLQEDDNNCGEVGNVCTGQLECQGGHCCVYLAVDQQQSCASACADDGMACYAYDGVPEFRYNCPDLSSLYVVNNPCGEVPPSAISTGGMTCTFDRIGCFCG